jgi:hypothetical protein
LPFTGPLISGNAYINPMGEGQPHALPPSDRDRADPRVLEFLVAIGLGEYCADFAWHRIGWNQLDDLCMPVTSPVHSLHVPSLSPPPCLTRLARHCQEFKSTLDGRIPRSGDQITFVKNVRSRLPVPH